jgi:hypothetical protein
MFPESEDSEIPSKPTIVVGVVHPHGKSCLVTRRKEWELRFAFETWRSEDGVLHPTVLTLSLFVSNDELRWYMGRIQPYGILTARVVFTEPAAAELLELPDKQVNADDALVQRAAELQKPKTFEYERFGTFTLNRRMDWYETTVMWMDNHIKLNLFATDGSDLEAALRLAVELWKDQSTWNQQIQEYAARNLLNLKNRRWLDEGDEELTSDDFKSRMSLAAITVYPNEAFEFWHDGSDLFIGQSILVSGNLQDGPTDADLPLPG